MPKRTRWGLGLLGAVIAVVSIALLVYAFSPSTISTEKAQVRLQPTVFQAPQLVPAPQDQP